MRSKLDFLLQLKIGLVLMSTGCFYFLTESKIAETQSLDPQEVAKALSKAFAQASARINPAVVSITQRHPKETPIPEKRQPSKETQTPPPDSPQEEQTPWGSEDGGSLGSGVIIDDEGTIITNAHVVGDATEFSVRTAQKNVVTAVLQRRIPQHDLAIIRAPGVGSVHALLGDSDELQIGEWVIAAGSPFGLEHSITAGIVSAKGRGVGGIKSSDFIQTDAPINPGNSGGPLVNLRGEVVGINTAIVSRTGGNIGIGFAIPITLVKKWLAEKPEKPEAGSGDDGGLWESKRIR
jgi:serine protease Do